LGGYAGLCETKTIKCFLKKIGVELSTLFFVYFFL
jgi:hypothetical protein